MRLLLLSMLSSGMNVRLVQETLERASGLNHSRIFETLYRMWKEKRKMQSESSLCSTQDSIEVQRSQQRDKDQDC